MRYRECPAHEDSASYSTSQSCVICRPLLKRFILEAVVLFPKFEVVAFTGSSGAAFGYWLADELNLETAHVLKPSEQTHGPGLGRGAVGATKTWLFLDDFTESGATYMRVKEAMGSEPVGALLYQPSSNIRYLHGGPQFGAWRSTLIDNYNEPEMFENRRT